MTYLYKALTGLYPIEVQRADDYLGEADAHDGFVEYFYSYIESLSDETRLLNAVNQLSIDIVAMAFRFIAECAHVPQIADSISANQFATSFDISSEEASQILNAVPEDQRNDAWQWVFKQTDSYLLDDENNDTEEE